MKGQAFPGQAVAWQVAKQYAACVDSRSEARDFLQTRRARLTPSTSGLSATGPRRRVPGLRREEVAQLAGVSVDYYTRLEKGHLETASYAVLDAIARALRLDRAERSHLDALAKAARGEVADWAERGDDALVRPSLTWMLEAMSLCPAYVRNGRMDVVASNAIGRELWQPMFDVADRPNLAVFCFLDPHAQTFFLEWLHVARGTVALLRAEVGRNPTDPAMDELVERLLSGSNVFSNLWTEHDVRQIFSETKRFEHPFVGTLTLAIEAQELIADPGLTMVSYPAEPGSASEHGLRRLSQRATTRLAALA